MVANILATYDRATSEQVNAGVMWYPLAGEIVATIAQRTGIDTRRVCMALAALSPRNPWRWNVADAYAFCSARAEGRTMPRATTFKRNWTAAWAALDPTTDVPWLTSAPKVRSFVEAILGDRETVVVDTWAVRVATDGAANRVGTDAEYRVVAHAYNVAANLCGMAPRDLQAVTWLVAQTEGLASHRRGRHDLVHKAGTPAWLMALV